LLGENYFWAGGRERTEEQMATAIASGEPARHRDAERGVWAIGLEQILGQKQAVSSYALY
jgi:hypothetical protein